MPAACRIGKGIGHFFGAMQIDGFIDKDEFKKQIDDWIQVFYFRQSEKPKPVANTSRRSSSL